MKYLYGVAIVASILLSFWIDVHNTIVNPDAICYLMSAETIGKAGVRAGMQLCGQAQWPFYSILIYGLAHYGHLSYAVAAFTLDAFFSALSVVMFILIVQQLGGSRRVLWLAAAVILLSHDFNSVREYIIRDHGFWAFYLCSILFLLKFSAQQKARYALAWGLSLIAATLFRIEGAIFLMLLPFIAFGYHGSAWQRTKAFLQLNFFGLLVAAGLITWIFLHPHQTLATFGRLQEVVMQFQRGIVMMAARYQTTQTAIAQYVLTMDSVHEAGLVLLLLMVAWYLTHVMTSLSWVYTGLVIYAWWRRAAHLTHVAVLVLGAYVFINMIITFGFLVERLFLSKRYLIALSLVFMLWVPFALNDLIIYRRTLKQKCLLSVALFLIAVSAVGGIFDFGYSKAYVRLAGDWMATHIPAQANVFSNDYQLMYYSQHFGDGIFARLPQGIKLDKIAHGQWKQYDYLALRVSHHQEQALTAILAEIGQPPLQAFQNQRGDKVIIYRIGDQA